MWQESEADQESTNLTRAQRRQIDITSAVVSADEARQEGSLLEVYGHNPKIPAEVPEPDAVTDPNGGELDDEAELQPVVAADPNAIPAGEQLVGARVAAERLGVSAGSIHRMAARGQFPAWRVGSRWRYALSLVEAAAQRSGRPVELVR